MSKDKRLFTIWPLLNELAKLIKSEVFTTVGRVNLACDLVLAAVVVAIFTANTFERVAIAVVSIWNSTITEYLSDASALTAFIILVLFFAACLVFLYFYEKIISRTKE